MNMKLGLLVALAVAVLVPSPSDSRIVSRCELKEKLENHLRFRFLPGWTRNKILARVICSLEKSHSLDTELGSGCLSRTTTTDPTTTRPISTTPDFIRPISTTPDFIRPISTTPGSVRPTSTTPGSVRPTSTTPGSVRPTSTTPDFIRPISTTPGTLTNLVPLNSNLTLNRRGPDGSNRRKRDADSSSEDERELEELVSEFEEDEEEVDSEMSQEDVDSEMSQEDVDSEMSQEEVDSEMSQEDVDSEMSQEDDASAAIRAKRSLAHGRCQPIGFYGIFLLNDRRFCNSGLNPSRNRCRTHCGAFTDDDITDDVDCFVRSGYWRRFYYRQHYQCRFRRYWQVRNFFKMCE